MEHALQEVYSINPRRFLPNCLTLWLTCFVDKLLAFRALLTVCSYIGIQLKHPVKTIEVLKTFVVLGLVVSSNANVCCFVAVREQLREQTKQYEKSENDLKALQSVGQVSNF